MAAIDKTYFKIWDQYQEVLDFCSKYEDGVIDEYGNKFRSSEFVLDWTKSDFIESISNQRRRYTEYYSLVSPSFLDRIPEEESNSLLVDGDREEIF